MILRTNELDLNRNIVSKNERLIKIKNELWDKNNDLEMALDNSHKNKQVLINEIDQLRNDLELADQTVKQYEQIINRLEER